MIISSSVSIIFSSVYLLWVCVLLRFLCILCIVSLMWYVMLSLPLTVSQLPGNVRLQNDLVSE